MANTPLVKINDSLFVSQINSKYQMLFIIWNDRSNQYQFPILELHTIQSYRRVGRNSQRNKVGAEVRF